MALPEDVTTFELTFGPYTDAAGEPVFAGMTGKIKPSFPQIRHVESGAVVIDSPIPVEIDGFGMASVQLAHTDQAVLSPVGFTYSVVWSVASRKPSPGNKQIAVPTSAGAEVDFDLLAPSPDVEGVVVPLTYGKSAYDLAVENGFVGTEDAWLASLVDPEGLADPVVSTLVTNTASATSVAMRAAFVPVDGLVFNAKDHGAKGDGTTDDAPALNALIQTVRTAGGVVYLPPGTYRLTSAINSEAKVSIIGAGMKRTILKPEGAINAILGSGSSANPISDVLYQDFEIDGSAQTGLVKGIFAVHMRRCRFVRIYCHDTGASGLGVDYLYDSSFISCIVEGAGRNGTSASPGCSGFGIGTGQYAVENVVLVDCVARNNKRYGVFFERLSGALFYSRGPQVIGGRFEGNYRGIGDNGSRGAIINGATVYANLDDGIFVGADQSTDAGYDGLITGCYVAGNGRDGIRLDWSTGVQHGRYSVRNNHVEGNVGIGVRAVASAVVPGVVIDANRVERNNRSGILVSGGSYTDLSVCRNKVNANGQTDTGGVNNGIHTITTLTRPIIDGNHCHDDGATKKQVSGIILGPGSVTGGRVSNNSLVDNLTAPLTVTATVTTGASGTVIRDNLGYNPIGWDSLAPGASPWTYQAGPTDEVINLLSGTVSNVAVTDRTGTTTNVALSAPASIPLGPWDTMVVTYSSAPAAKRLRK